MSKTLKQRAAELKQFYENISTLKFDAGVSGTTGFTNEIDSGKSLLIEFDGKHTPGPLNLNTTDMDQLVKELQAYCALPWLNDLLPTLVDLKQQLAERTTDAQQATAGARTSKGVLDVDTSMISFDQANAMINVLQKEILALQIEEDKIQGDP